MWLLTTCVSASWVIPSSTVPVTPACLGWTGRVCAALIKQGYGVTYYNLGVRRETSSDVAARWRQEVTSRLTHGSEVRLVFSFGVNDTMPQGRGSRVSYTDSLANTESILRSARAVAPTLMVGPQPIADKHQNVAIANLARGVQVVCATVGVPFLEVLTPLHKSTVWMDEVRAGDGGASGGGRLCGVRTAFPRVLRMENMD